MGIGQHLTTEFGGSPEGILQDARLDGVALALAVIQDIQLGISAACLFLLEVTARRHGVDETAPDQQGCTALRSTHTLI